MNYNSICNWKVLIGLTALTAFLIALIPTLNNQWPLSWDIIYHVQYSQVYAHYGFTLTDPLLDAPIGKKIAYPPLFHFLIAGLGTGLGVDFFQVARFLQPILATSIILSVSYVAYKLYGAIAGAGAGFLILSSYLVSRIILPLPENLALIFIPLAVYFYYCSLKNNSLKNNSLKNNSLKNNSLKNNSLKNKYLKYGFLGGLFFIAVISTHQAATLCLSLVIISITLLELLYYRNLSVFKNFIAFFLPIIIIVVAGLICLQIWAPQLLQNIINGGINSIIGATSLPSNRSLGVLSYLRQLGILVLIFSLIGGVAALKNHRRKDLMIIVWILSMFLLSNAYWFGINVITYRVLIYLLIPLSILGGYGINYTYHKLKDYNRFSSKSLRTSILVIIFVLSTLSGILTVQNPEIAVFGVKTDYGMIQISPPSNAELDLANWFLKNGDKNLSILIQNQFTGIFLTTETMIPIHSGFEYFSTSENVYIDIDKPIKTRTLSSNNNETVGYIVYDKKLVISPPENNLSLRIVDTEFYPLFYFTQDISSNINKIKPDYTQVVYENDEFIVCKIEG